MSELKKAGPLHAGHLLITCEHGGNEVPPEYAALLADHQDLLDTHRGWDPGALELARDMEAAFRAPLFAATTTRLLIDLNRSPGHKQLHSEATRGLPLAARRKIALEHYRPHRDQVEAEVARRIKAGRRVVHIAAHSFAPELRGVVRPDVAWLYDPRRADERTLAGQWLAALKRRRPELALRRNFPYQGKYDGLTSLLRKRHAPGMYIGMEIEINQRFVVQGGPAWEQLRAGVIAALADVLGRPEDEKHAVAEGEGPLLQA